ncbi:MAG: phage major capsid protein [Oscillospiraceae bacterium]
MKFNALKDAERQKFTEDVKKALEENDSEAIAKTFAGLFEKIQNEIVDEAKSFDVTKADNETLRSRGFRVLTSTEKSFFEKMIDSAKTAISEKALMNLTEVLPETEINAIFEDMKDGHPLLQKLKFTNTAALSKFILNTAGPAKALWGQLTTAITKEIEGGVNLIEIPLGKLTAYMLMSNDMLDLGPIWIEKYVRTSLAEALSCGQEDGYINGNGIAGNPIGMNKNIADGVSVNQTTGYPEKAKTVVTDLSVKTYGKILSKLSKNPAGKSRIISSVAMIVNPVDYFSKIMPATTFLTNTGVYAKEVVPFNTEFIQCPEVKEGTAIIGLLDKYFAGIGTGSNGGQIEPDKSFKFLEDVTTYKIKLYGSGRAYDDNCFVCLDISGLLPLGEVPATPPKI